MILFDSFTILTPNNNYCNDSIHEIFLVFKNKLDYKIDTKYFTFAQIVFYFIKLVRYIMKTREVPNNKIKIKKLLIYNNFQNESLFCGGISSCNQKNCANRRLLSLMNPLVFI